LPMSAHAGPVRRSPGAQPSIGRNGARACSGVTSSLWISRPCCWVSWTSSSSVPCAVQPHSHFTPYCMRPPPLERILGSGRWRIVGGALQTLRVYLAGKVCVERDEHLVPERRLPGGQGRLVFAYLAAEHERAVHRDELADELWHGEPPRAWEAALRVVVS